MVTVCSNECENAAKDAAFRGSWFGLRGSRN
jgi:hypothetical protein